MFGFLKRKLKWNSSKNGDNKNNMLSSHSIAVITGILEDLLFWKKFWLSIFFILVLNVIFFVCINDEINLFNIFIYLNIAFLIIDAFETWLKYKHRTTCLKRLADHDGPQLKKTVSHLKILLGRKWLEFTCLRDSNHTKAFLMMNIVLGVLFLTGQYLSGYFTIYLICMAISLFYKVAPPVIKAVKRIQQNAESDMDFEGLIPEVSEVDINLLTIEPEVNPVYDERQSLDYWKPNDVPLEEASDSSDNSSSLVTNLSIEKMQSLDKNIETSDSSEDEYIPLDQQQKEQLLSTVEEVRPTPAWGTSAYNALWNITGAVANMVYTKTDSKRQRILSVDSSDGFEMVDKQDLM